MCIKLNMSDKWKILIGTVFFLKKKKAQKAKLNTKRKVSQIPILEAS